MKVMIVVTHLLGTGHLSRALTLGRAFGQAGHEVTLVSGGMAAPQLDQAGVRFCQLPPLRSDGTNFARLLGSDGAPATPRDFNARSTLLCEIFDTVAPDIVITELYPFGRRILADEFMALLTRARTAPRRPVILASVRDILAPPSKPAKADRAHAVIDGFYDGVLVHSDRHTTPLDQSWPVTDALRPKLFYTGYVAPPTPTRHPDALGQGELLVSAGGGSVGADLFRAAVDAAALMPGIRWRLLVGGRNAAAEVARLQQQARGSTIVEPARPDFRQMLTGAAASVSMCGYNTALDILQTGARAVVVPFDAGDEVEQGLRAVALANLPAITRLSSSDLTSQSLARAVGDVLAAPARGIADLGFDGAAQSVTIATDIAKARL